MDRKKSGHGDHKRHDNKIQVHAITLPGWHESDSSGAPESAQNFPDNSEQLGSDEVTEIVCDPCEISGKKHLAQGFCKTCSEFLCSTCYNDHRRFKPTRHHILLNSSEMPLVKKKHAMKDLCTTICSNHESSVIEYYCRSCDQFGCSHCFVAGHRECSVASIQDMATGLEHSSEYKLFNERLAKLQRALRVNRIKCNSSRSDIDSIHHKAQRDIRNQRKAVNTFFDKLEEQVDCKINEIRKVDKEELQYVSGMYDRITTDFEGKMSEIRKMENEGRKSQLFVEMKSTIDYLKDFEKKINLLKEQTKIYRYELLLSDEVLNMMESLKEISVFVKKFSVWERKPKFSGKIDMRTSSDKKECYITGMCLLSTKYLLAADLNNVCVKIVDLKTSASKNIVQIISMRSWPWDVTKMPDEQAAITLPLLGEVCFLTKNRKMRKWFASKSIDVGLECRGIEYSMGKLVVSFTTETASVKIIALNSDVLHVFSSDKNGEKLFLQPSYLALGLDQKVIYVSDNETHTVTSLDMGGNVKDVYKNDDLRCSTGLTIDRTESIFVCGSRYCNVHQIYSDLSPVQILLDHSNAEEKPQCIAYCPFTNRIFIGFQNQNFVNIFYLT